MFRSILFVPASRPDRYLKALESGADAICIDLEDAVPVEEKPAARKSLAEFPSATTKTSTCLRINSLDSEQSRLDLDALSVMKVRPDFLMVPKIDSREELDSLSLTLELEVPVLAIIESASGLLNSETIASHTSVSALLFGSADYSTDIGSSMSWDALLYARSRIIAAAAAAQITVLDGAWLDIGDEQGLKADTARIKDLGFDGRVAIHPRQIESIHAGFAPTEQELHKAELTISAFENAGRKAVQINGLMIDQPVYDAAKAVLARVIT